MRNRQLKIVSDSFGFASSVLRRDSHVSEGLSIEPTGHLHPEAAEDVAGFLRFVFGG